MLNSSENFVITNTAAGAAVLAQSDDSAISAINAPAGGKCTITDTKFYVPAATLTNQDNTKLM